MEGPAGRIAAPLTVGEFGASLARFAPFETAPHLAVAVSGGPDSMCLALLAAEWARASGGRVTALTVDHRLRRESGDEAAQVAAWLGRCGIAHETLAADAPLPRRNLQAMARALRYELLERWCAAAGVLHLLTAHHRDDQAETFLLRLARGSGVDGLAGIAMVVERAQCRVLRPLLAVPGPRLRATLAARGQAWIEDPSNRDLAFARVGLREGAAVLAAAGLTGARLAATAARLGRARAAIEAAVATVLAQAVQLDPAGFAWLAPGALVAAPEEVGLRALAALLATVAGADHGPRLERLERLFRLLPDGLARGRTLGGCRVLPHRGGLLVCREAAAVAPAVAARPGEWVRWDGRFSLATPARAPAGVVLGPLGCAAAAAARAVQRVPAAVRPTLPALYDAAGILAVPHLGYRRPDCAAAVGWPAPVFRPARPLAGAGFTVV